MIETTLNTTLNTLNSGIDQMMIQLNLADYQGNRIEYLYWKTQINQVINQAKNS
jgi:hypothetical protein